mmetsp:Transcript_11546/g.27148  ORF Transcript_11546/g.27148 Transcript_11546/m.27148 type:complete len:272 (-) Transcript_11546:100-915(-)
MWMPHELLTATSGPRLQLPSTPSRSYHIWWILPLDSVARTLPLTGSRPSYEKYLTKEVAAAPPPSMSWAMSSCPWSALPSPSWSWHAAHAAHSGLAWSAIVLHLPSGHSSLHASSSPAASSSSSSSSSSAASFAGCMIGHVLSQSVMECSPAWKVKSMTETIAAPWKQAVMKRTAERPSCPPATCPREPTAGRSASQPMDAVSSPRRWAVCDLRRPSQSSYTIVGSSCLYFAKLSCFFASACDSCPRAIAKQMKLSMKRKAPAIEAYDAQR